MIPYIMLLALVCHQGGVHGQRTDPPPNIIVITIDDWASIQAWSASTPAGDDLNGTPVSYQDLELSATGVQAFINEAVWFPTAYTAAPKCTPSRFASLTGRMPSRSKWGASRTLLTTSGYFGVNVTLGVTLLSGEDATQNVPYILQHDARTPYYTGFVGKWHLMSTNDFGNNYGCSNLDRIANVNVYGLCTDLVKTQGFDFVDAFYVSNIESNTQFSHNPEWMVSQAQRFINTAVNSEGKPFFLHFATTLNNAPDVVTALQSFSYTQTPKGTLMGEDVPNDTAMLARAAILANAEAAMANRNNAAQEKMAAAQYWVDDMVGALITYLKANNLYDNTMIVLQSDHNDVAKGVLYQQGTRILHWVRYPPLFPVASAPHIMPEDFVVSNVDLAAVIFDVAGVTPPAGYTTDGRSWVSDVLQQIANPNTATSTCCEYRFMDMYNSHSIANDRFQYIYRQNPNVVETENGVSTYYANMNDEEQFYDLESDPNEQTNQINNAVYADQIIKFQTMMREYLADTCPIDTGCKMPEFHMGTLEPTQPTNAPTTPAPITNSNAAATLQFSFFLLFFFLIL